MLKTYATSHTKQSYKVYGILFILEKRKTKAQQGQIVQGHKHPKTYSTDGNPAVPDHLGCAITPGPHSTL